MCVCVWGPFPFLAHVIAIWRLPLALQQQLSVTECQTVRQLFRSSAVAVPDAAVVVVAAIVRMYTL